MGERERDRGSLDLKRKGLVVGWVRGGEADGEAIIDSVFFLVSWMRYDGFDCLGTKRVL